MTKSMNSCHFTGRVTRDAELRSTGKGTEIAIFSIAVNNSWIDRETGETHEAPNFFEMQIGGERAAKLAPYIKKGVKVAVHAQAHWHRWETADGQTRSAVNFRVDHIEILNRPKDADHEALGNPQPETKPAPVADPML